MAQDKLESRIRALEDDLTEKTKDMVRARGQTELLKDLLLAKTYQDVCIKAYKYLQDAFDVKKGDYKVFLEWDIAEVSQFILDIAECKTIDGLIERITKEVQEESWGIVERLKEPIKRLVVYREPFGYTDEKQLKELDEIIVVTTLKTYFGPEFVYIPDTSKLETEYEKELAKRQGVGAFVNYIIHDEKIKAGSLHLTWEGTEPYKEDELRENLDRVNSVIAAALKNVRLIEEIRKKNKQLEHMGNLSKTMNADLDPRTIYTEGLKTALEVIEAETGSIVNKQERELEIISVHSKNKELNSKLMSALEGYRLNLGQGIVGSAIDDAKSIIVNYAPADERHAGQIDRETGYKTRQILVAPIIYEGTVRGALELINKSEGFSKDDLSLAENICGHMALALHNAEMYDAIRDKSRRDGLTDLYNHAYFHEKLEEVIKYDKYATLVMFDLDHFKAINDGHGHPVGDEVLRRIAAIINKNIRGGYDVAARYGGEEFAVIFPRVNHVLAYKIAERIRTAIASENFSTDMVTNIKVNVSGGISNYPLDAKDKKQLIEQADQTLYYVKDNGRNMCKMYKEIKGMLNKIPLKEGN